MLDNFVDGFRQWRNFRDTVDELNRLSNRDLKDLGISRGDIAEVARQSVSK